MMKLQCESRCVMQQMLPVLPDWVESPTHLIRPASNNPTSNEAIWISYITFSTG
jgi:hypothetical protein